MGEKNITSAQCRAARALIGWTREQLAEASSVSKMTLADFETGKRKPYARTLADIQRALEGAGIEFLDKNGAGSGLRFREREAEEGGAD